MAKRWISVIGFLWGYAQPPCDTLYELAGYAEWPSGEVEVIPPGKRFPIQENGEFHIHGLCTGEYLLRVYFEGHVVAEQRVSLPQEKPLVIEGKEKLHAVTIEGHAPRSFHIQPVERIKTAERGIAQQIQEVPGVAVGQAGPLLAKPILEGLRGTRVAYWQGGQPLASQQWGEDHAPEVDPFSAEEIEVRVGPSPVRYGTEAVGGAIILPLPSVCCLRKPFSGTIFLSGMANGRGGVAGIELRGIQRGWGYRIQSALLRTGTFRSPHYYLTGTATAQWHGSFTLHRLWSHWQLRFFYAQYNAFLGIFQGMHVGNLTDLERALQADQPLVASTFSYRLSPPYQKVAHELATLQVSYLSANEAVWSLTLGRQYNRRQEYDPVGIYAGDKGIGLDLQLTTYFVQLTYERGRWLAGLFSQYQRNFPQYAYFIPFYERWQGGIFSLYRWKRWEGGFRAEPLLYDCRQVILREGGQAIPRRRSIFFPLAVEITYNSWIRVEGSFLTRAPNAAELYAFGYHQAQGAFLIGAPTLRSEPTFALRLSQQTERFTWGVGGYYSPAFVWERIGDPILSLRGAALTLEYGQSPALRFSLSGRWRERIGPFLIAELRGAYVWGSIWEKERWLPLPLLPPFTLTPVLRATYRQWEIEAFWYQQFRQVRYTPWGEYTPPPPGYGILGAAFAWQMKSWRITLSGENLLNRTYRAYPDLMRFFAHQIGRQFRIVLLYTFAKE